MPELTMKNASFWKIGMQRLIPDCIWFIAPVLVIGYFQGLLISGWLWAWICTILAWHFLSDRSSSSITYVFGSDGVTIMKNTEILQVDPSKVLRFNFSPSVLTFVFQDNSGRVREARVYGPNKDLKAVKLHLEANHVYQHSSRLIWKNVDKRSLSFRIITGFVVVTILVSMFCVWQAWSLNSSLQAFTYLRIAILTFVTGCSAVLFYAYFLNRKDFLKAP